MHSRSSLGLASRARVRDIAFALLAWLWMHEAHTDASRRHRLHFGKDANGVTLYLDSGEKFAFRGRQAPHGYDRVEGPGRADRTLRALRRIA